MKIILSLILISLSLFGSKSVVITQKQQSDLGVKTETIQRVNSILFGPYNGVVTLDKKDILLVSSNIQAVASAIYVREFDFVKKGQKLLSIRSSELLNLQKDYLEAQIQSQSIDKIYDRDLKLYNDGVIAQKRVLSSQSEKQNSDLRVNLSKNQLLQSGFTTMLFDKLQRTHMPIDQIDIVAPRDGFVDKININTGGVIVPQSPILIINGVGQRFIEMSVPLRISQNLSFGDICLFDKYSAKIVNISNIVNSSSQSVQVRAVIEKSKDVLINRIYGVTISKAIKRAFKIKKSALVFDGNRSLVFKKVTSGFETIDVKIISEEADSYIVDANLKEKDELATSSTSALHSALESIK